MLGKAVLRRARIKQIIADLPLLSNDELAGKYALSLSTVARYRSKYKIPSPVQKQRPKPITPETEKEIISLRRSGCRYEDITRKLNINRYYIVKVLSQPGIGLAKAPQKKRPHPVINVNYENCIPAIYSDNENNFDWFDPKDPESSEQDRARYEQLRKWKHEKALRRESELEELGPIYSTDEDDDVY